MPAAPTLDAHTVLARSRARLGMTHAEFGRALRGSERSSLRWTARQASLIDSQWVLLAQRLAPVDAALAEEAARHGHETLESLGLGPERPPEPEAPKLTERDLADLVVCAVAELAHSDPGVQRPLLHAAFRRAREVGLSLEAAERGLGPRAVVRTLEAARKKRAATTR